MAPVVALAAELEEGTGSHVLVAGMRSRMAHLSTDLVGRNNTSLDTVYGRHTACGPRTASGRHTAVGCDPRTVSARWAVVREADIARRE